VAWGIRIKTEAGNSFFLLAYQVVEKLKEFNADSDVAIEVTYFDKYDDNSGTVRYKIRNNFKWRKYL
jgi:hypothetical protein